MVHAGGAHLNLFHQEVPIPAAIHTVSKVFTAASAEWELTLSEGYPIMLPFPLYLWTTCSQQLTDESTKAHCPWPLGGAKAVGQLML